MFKTIERRENIELVKEVTHLNYKSYAIDARSEAELFTQRILKNSNRILRAVKSATTLNPTIKLCVIFAKSINFPNWI